MNLLSGGQVDLTRQEWQVVELPVSVKDPIDAVNFAGNFGGSFYLDDMRLVTAARPPIATAIEEDDSGALPLAASLEQNYPNPFNPATTIQYSLPRADYVDMSVFNLTGQKVASLVSRTQPAGTHRFQWDGHDDAGRELASGVYLYRLRVGQTVQSRKLLLLR